ncbi:MAG: tetratricopeptide repeat protein [Symploca sp. SIO2C1]|nr:tetratricopeptide repeat protein [Symploca sp. SIO2C1]
MSQSKRSPEPQCLDWLQQAKVQAEQIATSSEPEFSSELFLFAVGNGLYKLRRIEDAIASYDKAIEFNPDDDAAWYNKACFYALQNNCDLAIENLQQAIHLNPDEYREMAKTDSDFDNLRSDTRFQALIQD